MARTAPRGRSHLAAAALLGIFLTATAGLAYHTVQVTEWIVMTDELQYSKLSLAIFEDLSLVPRLHGDYYGSLSQLYPLLLAPFHGLLDMPDAFRAIHAWNAVIMASACLPAYLLARAVGIEQLGALLAAALSVAVPWMSLSAMILTDVAAYPAFLWAVLAIERALVRPSPGRDLVALAGIALAVGARTQFVVLAPALPVAALAHELLYGWHARGLTGRQGRAAGVRQAAASHALLFSGTAIALLITVVVGVNASVGRVVGNYAGTLFDVSLGTPGLWPSAVRHLDFVIVGIGVLPFLLAAAFCINEIRAPSDRARHAFAILLLVLAPTLAISVVSFVVRYTAPNGTYDRYLCYLAPLLFVGMIAFLVGSRRAVGSLMLAALACAALLSSQPLTTPAVVSAPVSPVSAFHVVLDGRSQQLGALFGLSDLQPPLVLIFGMALVTVTLALVKPGRLRRVALVALGLGVLAFNIAETRYVFKAMLASQPGARAQFQLPYERRDWIDDALPAGATAALIPSTAFEDFESGRIWWETEFWNKTVDRAFAFASYGPWTPFGRGRTITADRATGRLTSTQPPGSPSPTPYLVVGPYESRFSAASQKVVETPGGFKLIEAELPYRAAWVSVGLSPDGSATEGKRMLVRLFPDRDGRPRPVRLKVAIDLPVDSRRPARYILESGDQRRSGSLGALARKVVPLDVCVPASSSADVRLRVRGKVALPDGIQGALRVRSIDSERLAGSCRPVRKRAGT